MSRLLEWFDNRWDCISNDVDIPLLDTVICSISVPIFILAYIALVVTVPVWGIPYVIYRVYWSERREDAQQRR